MNILNKYLKIFFVLLLAGCHSPTDKFFKEGSSNQSHDIAPHRQTEDEKEAREKLFSHARSLPEEIQHERWTRLATELGIHNNKILRKDLSKEKQEFINTIEASFLPSDEKQKIIEELTTDALVSNLKDISTILSEERSDDFLNFLKKLGGKFSQKAYLTRCSQIVSLSEYKGQSALTPDPTTTKLVREPDAKVYIMKYKLQADKEGNQEKDTRSGLVVIPTTKISEGPALLAFSHGGDAGLSYRNMADQIGMLQKDHVIIAPAFPGEDICKGGNIYHDDGTRGCDEQGILVKASGSSVAWDNDVDDLLGIHHCVERLFTGEVEKASPVEQKLKDLIELKDKVSSKEHYSVKMSTGRDFFHALRKGAEKIDPKTWTGWFASTRIADYALSSGDIHDKLKLAILNSQPLISKKPISYLFGTSRGGLVASLAAARAGMTWDKFTDLFDKNGIDMLLKEGSKLEQELEGKYTYQIPALAEPFLDDLNIKIPAFLNELKETFGKKYSFYPPTFSRLVMLSSPAILTAGQTRFIMEQVFKGHLKITDFKKLPGLLSLEKKFQSFIDDPNPSEEDVENMALEVMSRDLSFMFPYILASIRDWSTMPVTNVNQLGRGKLLHVHGNEDRIIPFTEAQLAFNVFRGMQEVKEVREHTKSKGLDMTALYFELPAHLKGTKPEQHVEESFWLSKGILPVLVQERVRDSYMAGNGWDDASVGESRTDSMQEFLAWMSASKCDKAKKVALAEQMEMTGLGNFLKTSTYKSRMMPNTRLQECDAISYDLNPQQAIRKWFD